MQHNKPLGPLRLAPEVQHALDRRQGVVALESTLIAQGLPWPENLETARASEDAVRRSGSVPATIAVTDGHPTIGLDSVQIEHLARSGSFAKASRRDLSAVVHARKNAATTVSATLFLARRAGISVMATGGLGGVHRGASQSFDISADLDELARANGSLVVCSGVKSILDVPATLERLETLGVSVVGYRTGDFPAFTTSESGLSLESRVETPADAAGLLASHRTLDLPGAIVLAQPVEKSVEVPRDQMEAALTDALANADRLGISGKAITPFLLDFVRLATSGRSLIANRALIEANAALAGEVAAALALSPRTT
jgi:pseudouridine-5'-phosphate glycosidase